MCDSQVSCCFLKRPWSLHLSRNQRIALYTNKLAHSLYNQCRGFDMKLHRTKILSTYYCLETLMLFHMESVDSSHSQIRMNWGYHLDFWNKITINLIKLTKNLFLSLNILDKCICRISWVPIDLIERNSFTSVFIVFAIGTSYYIPETINL